MRPRVWISLLVLAALGILGWQLVQWRNQPPVVEFAQAIREDISSVVSTNGKVEAAQSATARAEVSGAVTRILVQLRQRVTKGATLVEIDAGQAAGDLEAAEARIAQIRTELAVLDQGGRRADLARLQGEIDAATLALQQAQREYDTELRLDARQATTKMEVKAAKDAVDKIQQQIASLQQQKAALVAPTDRANIEAQLRGAEAARRQAQLRIGMSSVVAPIDGVVYEFDLKPGAYLNPGEPVATIGRLDPVHVNVAVDEPDLGRVERGKPVTITWDALPGREWIGTVDRLPVKVVSQGSRQVGEVICVIPNPDGDLLVGTNVDVVILSETARNAITIPKSAVFHEGGQAGVYVRKGDRLEWRTITEGINNVSRLQVQELQEGDEVALPGDRPLSDGMLIRP